MKKLLLYLLLVVLSSSIVFGAIQDSLNDCLSGDADFSSVAGRWNGVAVGTAAAGSATKKVGAGAFDLNVAGEAVNWTSIPANATTGLTIAGWNYHNTPTSTDSQMIFWRGTSGGTPRAHVGMIANNDGNVQIFKGNGASHTPYETGAGALYFPGTTWYHWVVRFDTNNGISLWVNGVLNKSATNSAAWTDDTAVSFVLGRRESDNNSPYAGFMDEVAIWGRNITDAEVTDLYNSGSGRSCAYINGTAGGGDPANLAPNFTINPAIVPATAFSNDTLNCTFTPFDALNSSIYANVTWLLNGVANLSFDSRELCTNSTVCSTSRRVNGTRPYTNWTCRAGLDEGVTGTLNYTNSALITINNRPPNITAVNYSLVAANLYFNVTLTANATYADNDTDTGTVFFNWSRNGITIRLANSTSVASGTIVSDTLPLGSYTAGDNVSVNVSSIDNTIGVNLSSAYTQMSALTVSNYVPRIQSFTFANSSVYFNTSLTANATYIDPEGVAGTVFFNWTVNGVTKKLINSSFANGTIILDILTAFNYTSADNITVNVSVIDTANGTIGSSVVTAINTSVSNFIPPSIQTVNIFRNQSLNVSLTNSSATTNASFNCTATYDDFENTTGYIEFSWIRNGVLVDESSVNRTTADLNTGYSVTLGDADTIKNDVFACRVRVCDNFNSSSCSEFTNSTVNIINSAPIIQQINITGYKTLPGTNITIFARATDLDGGADFDRYEVWFNSSNYTNNQFDVNGNSAVALINISISPYFRAGNFSINVTFFDDTGQHRVNPPNDVNGDNKIEVYPGISRTDPNISQQITQSFYLRKNIVPAFSYIRQLALTNPLLTAIPISGNTTLPSADYVINSSISLINQSGNASNYTGIDNTGFINFTATVPANSTLILNLTYNVTPIVISNITSICTLTNCDVNFTIENRHIFKIDDVDLIIDDVDLPNWNDRTIVQAFWNLVNGTGTGQYERRIASTVASNYAYTQTNYSVNVCTGTCIQDDPTLPSISLTSDNSNTSNTTGTDGTTTSSNNEVPFSLGSLKVDNVDLGASSTYVLRVSYQYSTQESSSASPGGGGGGGMPADKPLALSAGNISVTIKTDRGGSIYNLFMTDDMLRQKPLIIKNVGTAAATLGFSCEELTTGVCGWITYNVSSLTLKPNEDAEVMMLIKTPPKINNGEYKSNVFVFNNDLGLKGRLPVVISISALGNILGYLDKFQDKFTIRGNASSGGKDINIPVFLVSLMALLAFTPGLWYLFTAIVKMNKLGEAHSLAKYGGLIAFAIAIIIALTIPLFA